MIKQAGFNLIEVLTVMVILALLGALAIPRFTDVKAGLSQTTEDEIKNAVMSAHSIAIAALKDFPTVIQLQTYVDSDSPATVTDTGLRFALNDTSHTVLTYTDAACVSPTRSAADRVLCIGSIMR